MPPKNVATITSTYHQWMTKRQYLAYSNVSDGGQEAWDRAVSEHQCRIDVKTAETQILVRVHDAVDVHVVHVQEDDAEWF